MRPPEGGRKALPYTKIARQSHRNDTMNRRDLLKVLGTTTATGVAAFSCADREAAERLAVADDAKIERHLF